MAFPWMALAVALPTLVDLLFGSSGDEQQQTTTSETTNPTYRSPALGMMEPGILSALLGNAQAMGGAGMPGGKSRFGGDANSMFSDVISMLSKEWPKIMAGYGAGGTSNPNQQALCEKRCVSAVPWDSEEDRQACYERCMKGG